MIIPIVQNIDIIWLSHILSSFLCFYRPQRSFHRRLSFCPQRGYGRHPPGRPGQNPPWADIPQADTPCPVQAGIHTPQRPLQQMVCILLECILVKKWFCGHYSICGTRMHSTGMCTARLLTVSQHALGRGVADTPLRTDRHLWKHNLRKLHLWAVIIVSGVIY